MKRTHSLFKTALVIIALLASSASLFAEGSKEQSPATSPAKKMIVNVASTFPPDSPQDKGLQKFKELVAQKSDGRIDVLIHAASAMGDERQTFEMLSTGSVEFGAVGTNDIATFFPKYAVAEVPYIFTNVDQFWKYWAGPGKELSDMIESEKGVRTMGVVLRGARYMTSSRPINSVADVKGLKIRLPPVKAWVKAWESIGALPVTVAFGEVYMALKTGAVEAQENPPETILNYKFYEAQKYLIATKHVYSAARIQTSLKWFNTLSAEDKALFTKAMEESIAFANDLTKNGDDEYVKELVAKGMVLIEVDLGEFQKAVAPAVQEFAAAEWDTAYFNKVRSIR
ncbi:MAG: TRAP transporter substrate-binding protein [Spirochaetota bacterium]